MKGEMEMKRYLVALSIFLIAVLVLVACGGAEPTPTPEPEAASEEPTEAPTETPTEAPAEEPTEEPTEEPMEESAEETMGVEKTIFVGPELVDCVGVGPQQCLQIKENPDDEYTLWYDPIDGFEHEEGYEYELVVLEEEVENPPADASSIKLTLVEEVSKTEAPMEVAEGECAITYEGETITIYQQAGLTGPLAQILGDGFINGTTDAVEAINASGGVCGAEFVINLQDSQYDPEQELTIYEQSRAGDPKPMFILTYGSGATIVLKDRVIEDEIVNIAAGLNAEAFYIPRDGWTVGVAPIYSDQFAGFLQWVSDNWDDVKPEGAEDEIVVGVIGWDNAFGAGATTPESLAYAEELGITVLPLELQEISPTADVTGQIQNLLLNGANVIYVQSLSFGPAQVIGTIHALGAWDSVVVGGVNWAINTDVANILGENAELMDGFYGVFPTLFWNDVDEPGVQEALAAFEAGGYPETDKGVSYLLSYGQTFGLRDILELAINKVGFENLDGVAFFDAMKEMGLVSAGGLYELDVRGENRAPRKAQIRQAQLNDEGNIEFVIIEDFFEMPDTRPPAE
jgi:branched-chain amino acid transport system substrate-binding protein